MSAGKQGILLEQIKSLSSIEMFTTMLELFTEVNAVSNGETLAQVYSHCPHVYSDPQATLIAWFSYCLHNFLTSCSTELPSFLL